VCALHCRVDAADGECLFCFSWVHDYQEACVQRVVGFLKGPPSAPSAIPEVPTLLSCGSWPGGEPHAYFKAMLFFLLCFCTPSCMPWAGKIWNQRFLSQFVSEVRWVLCKNIIKSPGIVQEHIVQEFVVQQHIE